MKTICKLALVVILVAVASFAQGPWDNFSGLTGSTNLSNYINQSVKWQTWAGDPNTHLAGTEGINHAWDTTNKAAYICTVTGNAAAAVWTKIPFLVMTDPGSNGMVSRSALGTSVARTLAGTANLITITNGDGVAGAPTFTVGSNVARLDISNTWGAGVTVNMANAAHLRVPNAAGYTPTANGHFGYDTTSNRFKGYSGAAVATFFDSLSTTDALQAATYCVGVGGVANTYGCTYTPAITAYVEGTTYTFKADSTNTGSATFGSSGLAAMTIMKPAGGSITTTLAAGDIKIGQIVSCRRDAAGNCQMVSQLGNAPTGTGDMLTATYNQSGSGVPTGSCTAGSWKADTSVTPHDLYRCNDAGTGYDGPFSVSDPTHSGVSFFGGLTTNSGSGIGTLDIGGTAIVYYMPAWDGSADLQGKQIVDGGAITCQSINTAKLPSGTVCHKLLLVDPTRYATGAGTANAQTAAYTPAITALVDGLRLCWKPTAANTTTTPTFSPDGLTAHTIVKASGALAANDIVTTAIACGMYNTTGTHWELQNPQTLSSGTAGPGYTATSTTSLVTAGSGSKAFTTQAGLAYTVGARVRATSAGTSEYMEGLVTAYSGTTLTATMDRNSGTGTHTDWNINLAGDVGATGSGTGDASTNVTSGTAGKQAVFADNTGKLLTAGITPYRNTKGEFVNGGSALVAGTTTPTYAHCETLNNGGTVDWMDFRVYPAGASATFKVWRTTVGTSATVDPTVAASLNTSGVTISADNTLRSTTFTDFSGGVAPTFAAQDKVCIQLSAVSGSPTSASLTLTFH